eukprot:7313291-Pyramimonas_sp.AAC.1
MGALNHWRAPNEVAVILLRPRHGALVARVRDIAGRGPIAQQASAVGGGQGEVTIILAQKATFLTIALAGERTSAGTEIRARSA